MLLYKFSQKIRFAFSFFSFWIYFLNYYYYYLTYYYDQNNNIGVWKSCFKTKICLWNQNYENVNNPDNIIFIYNYQYYYNYEKYPILVPKLTIRLGQIQNWKLFKLETVLHHSYNVIQFSLVLLFILYNIILCEN